MKKLKTGHDILFQRFVERNKMRVLFNKLFDRTFWKFIMVGTVNTIFGTAIMFIFYNILHCSYWISSASNYFFGSILSYILNRIFTFQNSENMTKTLPRFVINIILCYLIAYGMAKPMMSYVFSSFSRNIQENIAMLAGMCLFVGLNYIGQRFFVFKNKTKNNH